MSLRFVVQKRVADPRHDRPLLVLKRAHRAAIRTRLLAAEVFRRLPLRRDLEGARQQRLHGGHGHVFHFGERDLGPGAFLAPVLADDDFSPAVSQFPDPAKILGCELP